MKLYKIFVLIFLVIFITTPTLAATNDVIFDEDVTITDVTLGDSITDMIVFDDSTTEILDITNGILTITNPGNSFKVGSSDSDVQTIVILKNNTMESCTENSTPGATSVTLPTSSGVYTIKPLEATSCSNLCSSLSNTTEYNTYPTCGAVNCSSGYTLSGSGSNATCVAQSSGGGGGARFFAPPPITVTVPITTPNQVTQKEQSSYTQQKTTPDGSKITSTIKAKADAITGKIIESSVETIISPTTNPSDKQFARLDTSATSKIKEIKLDLTSEALQELIGDTKNDIKVNISSQEALPSQKTEQARAGGYLVGFDVYSINLNVGDKNVTSFIKPLTLSFDISNLQTSTQDLKAYYFDENKSTWKKAGDGGSVKNGKLVVDIYHLTDFGLMRETLAKKQTQTTHDRELQLQLITDDAQIVLESGTNLNSIIQYNNKIKDIEAQKNGMKAYTDPLIKNINDLTTKNTYAINNFIIYGTKSTQILGAGERAGVVNSYKSAFNKVPITKNEWEDCIKIANGRWPTQRSEKSENNAKKEFNKIYKRNADMNNANDNAAVTVITYGLRPKDRNLNSEKIAIKAFLNIYKYNPKSATDWDIVRAIAYSGTTR